MTASPVLLDPGEYAEFPRCDDSRPARGRQLEVLLSEPRTKLNQDSFDYWDAQGWVVNDPFAQMMSDDVRMPFGGSNYWGACAAGGCSPALASSLTSARDELAAPASQPSKGSSGPAKAAALGAADGEALLQVWPGGLAGCGLGLGDEPGPPRRLEAPRPSLGQLYCLEREAIGRGAFGVVRRARHRASGRGCVVKAVGRASGGRADAGLLEVLLRMSREAPHPNVALFLDALLGQSHCYVVMEELSGPELLSHVAELQPAPEHELQGVMRQVLGALAHLHDAVGIFHRDVKLGNFRFRGDPADSALVLLDFGFCGSVHRPYDGVVCGTTVFMAPEVSGRSARVPTLAAMDLWSAGVMLYVLLTGEQPFQEQEVRLLGTTSRTGRAQILQKAWDGAELGFASGEAVALLRQLLDLDPSSRITAAQALEHPWFLSLGAAW